MFFKLLLISCTQALDQIYHSSATPDPIFGGVAVSNKDIPENCELWINGCTSCGVRDRQFTMCDMVVC